MAASPAYRAHPERLETRYPSELYLPVFPRSVRDRPVAHLVDASLGGLRLLSSSRAAIGQRLELDVMVSTSTPALVYPITAGVRWCMPATNPSLFEIGAQYLAVSPADAASLLAHIRSYSCWT